MFFNNTYSLRKSKKTLGQAWTFYRKKRDTLNSNDLLQFENSILALQAAIEGKDRDAADRLSKQLETFCELHFQKPWWKSILDIGAALVFALLIAVIVRQSWFELYEIPTGSMRPTFREQDHLTVTKTAFGINVPLETEHFYFDPNLVQRTSVIIFSGDQLPVIDTDSTFMGIFPYTKRFIKRMIGKPGDILYFYGGKIWGIDKDGNFISELAYSKWMDKLEHIPFLNFDGVVNVPSPNQIVFDQMHLPLARIQLSKIDNGQGEIFNGKEWIADKPAEAIKPHDHPVTYSDFWGFGNFAMARLWTREQLQAEGIQDVPVDKNAVFYLELKHHPSVSYPKPQLYYTGGLTGITMGSERTFLPVQKKQLEALRDNLYTARFVIKDRGAIRYSLEEPTQFYNSPAMPDIPNATYEFYHGKAWKVGWGGYLIELPADHPLYNPSFELFQKLFNFGINWDTVVAPHSKSPKAMPSRYAYFRDGDLYLMGGKIYDKDDQILKDFVAKEKEKATQSTSARPYIPFIDAGPPMKEGKIDVEFIRHFGVKVPDHQYLVLGDNHAMSGDSRIFGFVPEANLQGAPSLIIWPPGPRWGFPFQKPYPLLVLPRLIVWAIALTIGIIWYVIHRRNSKIVIPVRNKS